MKKKKLHVIKNIGPVKIPSGKQNYSNYTYPVIDNATTNKHLSNDTAAHHGNTGGNASNSNSGE